MIKLTIGAICSYCAAPAGAVCTACDYAICTACSPRHDDKDCGSLDIWSVRWVRPTDWMFCSFWRTEEAAKIEIQRMIVACGADSASLFVTKHEVRA